MWSLACYLNKLELNVNLECLLLFTLTLSLCVPSIATYHIPSQDQEDNLSLRETSHLYIKTLAVWAVYLCMAKRVHIDKVFNYARLLDWTKRLCAYSL